VRSRLVVAVLAALVVTACASDDAPDAAEPAEAPGPTVAPAGRVVPIGPEAEGIVADPATGLVAVGVREPNRLLLVDGASGTVTSEVPLPGHVRHLQLMAPGGPVIVPGEDSGEVLLIDLPDGRVLDRVRTGEYPHDATSMPDGRLVAANEFGGTISVVEDGRVAQVVGGFDQPGGVVSNGAAVAVVDVGAFTLTVYDPDADRRLIEVDAGGRADPCGRGPAWSLLGRRQPWRRVAHLCGRRRTAIDARARRPAVRPRIRRGA
jgi:hypothetical protein